MKWSHLILPILLTGCLSAPEPMPAPDGGLLSIDAPAASLYDDWEIGDPVAESVYNPELDCVEWLEECYPVCDSNNPCSGNCLITANGEVYFCSPITPAQL